MLFFSFIIFLSINFLSSLEACEKGDICTTFNDDCGVVENALECDEFKMSTNVEKRKFRPCGFDGRSPLICCPTDCPIRTQTRFTRKIVDECRKIGKKPDDDDDSLTFRIIRGQESELGEFPHFAALGYQADDEYSFDCGGALISQNFVITAAHCAKPTRQPKVVRLGKTAANIYDEDDPNENLDVKIEKIFVHPNYTKRYRYNDIALLKLAQPVVFKSNIFPACLYPENDFESKNLIIAGLGRNDANNAFKRSTWINKATVREVPINDCRKEYRNTYGRVNVQGMPQGIRDDIICARDSINNADTCQGDSGSALKFLSDDTYYIVGITSSGISCDNSLPAFYTRVYSYLDWIEDIVWP